MPQLSNGGKWIFGWSLVREDRSLRIPPMGFKEYGFKPGEVCVLTRGSNRSGGFGLGKADIVMRDEHLQNRVLDKVAVREDGVIVVPEKIGIAPGNRLLVIRGSNRVLGFLSFGPIVDIASGYAGIEVIS